MLPLSKEIVKTAFWLLESSDQHETCWLTHQKFEWCLVQFLTWRVSVENNHKLDFPYFLEISNRSHKISWVAKASHINQTHLLFFSLPILTKCTSRQILGSRITEVYPKASSASHYPFKQLHRTYSWACLPYQKNLLFTSIQLNLLNFLERDSPIRITAFFWPVWFWHLVSGELWISFVNFWLAHPTRLINYIIMIS